MRTKDSAFDVGTLRLCFCIRIVDQHLWRGNMRQNVDLPTAIIILMTLHRFTSYLTVSLHFTLGYFMYNYM